jgi:TonB-dependent SusC/RagA subfamily outer membrane receptor
MAISSAGSRLAAALCLILLSSIPVSAQQRYTLEGAVRDGTTGEPISGAQVVVRGTSAGALTDLRGTYRLVALLRPGTYTVDANYIGREGQAREVTLGTDTLVRVPEIALRVAAVQLEEVVVTGTAGPTARRALGNAVSTVSAARLAEGTSVTIDQALQGKVAGAFITSNTGTPGGGVSVRLRGTSSIVGGAEPLYIVDGVIIDNNADQQLNLGYRSNTTNRLADLDPDDIERIEILKGAAASALYGSRANNGVVQIFTKRGVAGRPQITVGSTATFSNLERRIDFALTPVDTLGNDVARFDHQDLLFRDTWSNDSHVAVAGGNENTRYYIAAGWVEQNGIMLGSDHKKLNFRTNLDQRIGSWFDLGVGANYIRTWSDLQINGEQGSGGLLTAIVFTPTVVNLAQRDAVTGALVNQAGPFPNPLEVIENWRTGQEVSRFVGSLQAKANPVAPVTLEYRLGYDRYDMETFQSVPKYSRDIPLGSASSLNRRSTLLNNDITANLDLGVGASFRFTTSGGVNHTYQRVEQLNLSASDVVPGTRLVRGAIPGAQEALIEATTLGFFAQEQIGWLDRRFLTAAVRVDGSSTFGEDERWQVYPKVSGSWVLSQEPFFADAAGDFITQLRLRAALGFAGNQPPLAEAYARLPRFTQVTNINRLGLVPHPSAANPNLKPERQREWEAGVDLSVLADRIGAGFTYYDQRTTDLLLARLFTPSAGYTSVLDNVGVLSNRGIELELNTSNIETRDFGWSSRLIYSRNRNRVEELNVDPYVVGYTNRIQEGQPLGVHFMPAFQRDETGNVLLDDQGLPAPPVTQIVGNPWPSFTASLYNEFRLGSSWTAGVLFDGAFGHELWNQTRRIMDISSAGPLWDRRLRGEITQAYRARIQNIWEAYLEDASYVKLRDLSLRYTTSAPFVQRIGASRAQLEIVGRNLLTFTDYTGYDPEINMFGLSTVERGTDFAVYPNPRTVGFGIRLTY